MITLTLIYLFRRYVYPAMKRKLGWQLATS